jgi:hypothetical protein
MYSQIACHADLRVKLAGKDIKTTEGFAAFRL